MAAKLVSIIVTAESLLLSHIVAEVHAAPDFAIAAICRDYDSCIKAIRTHNPDLALIDESLPSQDILGVVSAMKAGQNRAQVLLVSREGSDAGQLTACHASGPLSDTSARRPLIALLRQAASGSGQVPDAPSSSGHRNGAQQPVENFWTVLTERERQIMRLVCKGWSNKEVGRHLGISEGTIKVHLHNMYQKLAIRNRTVLAGMAMQAASQFSGDDGANE